MFLVFDIGGTHMRVARSHDRNSFDMEPVVVPTPPRFDDGIERFADLARRLLGEQPCTAIAGGIAGPLNGEKRVLEAAPNLPDWVGKPLADELQRVVGTKEIYIENDAAIAGLGEANRGAGKGSNIVAYMSVGTGVGGARIVDGAIDKNAYGFEPGHQIMDEFGVRLEDLVGGRHLEEKYKKRPLEIFDEQVWNEAARNLSRGVANVILLWSPHIVVIGGALAAKIPFRTLTRETHAAIEIFTRKPQIVPARFGDRAGLEGGLALLNAHGTIHAV